MPICKLFTNIPSQQVSKTFAQDLASLLANLLGKPADKVMILLKTDQQMIFGATNDPCATMYLDSIGKIDAKSNKKYSAKISEFLDNELGIPSDRCYINFFDLDPNIVGFNGSTKAECP